MIVRSPKTSTKAPNQDRAKVMVEALKSVQGDVALIGISNQGSFMPLVAAERPVRRIVMINAVVAVPGKSFEEAFDFKEVFATCVGARQDRQLPDAGVANACARRSTGHAGVAVVSSRELDEQANARIVENGSAASSGVSKSAKVVLRTYSFAAGAAACAASRAKLRRTPAFASSATARTARRSRASSSGRTCSTQRPGQTSSRCQPAA